MKITISNGNTKLGKVYNISVPPVLTCPKGIPCVKDCYALKAWKQYPPARAAWQGNLNAFDEDPISYFGYIADYCIVRKVERFRWHVGGEITSLDYYHGMVKVAECAPETQFLAFTKMAEYIMQPRPDNLRLVASMWPDLLPAFAVNPKLGAEHALRTIKDHSGIAWMEPVDRVEITDKWYLSKLDTEVKTESIKCSGKCDECFMCWYLEPGSSVIFHQH